jgi:hypothetical protein
LTDLHKNLKRHKFKEAAESALHTKDALLRTFYQEYQSFKKARLEENQAAATTDETTETSEK